MAVVGVTGSENLVMNVKLKNGQFFERCDIPERPFGENEQVVAVWLDGKIRMFPLRDVEFCELYEYAEGNDAGFNEGVRMLSIPNVAIGQKWKRVDGTVVEVRETRMVRGFRNVLLVPVSVPKGKRARKSWKWDAAVRSEMTIAETTQPCESDI